MRESLSADSDIQFVIDVDEAHKHFGATHALDGLTLQVRQGEVHGFLGPNGAGKSTTIRALLGQLTLDAGSARVFGLDAWRQPRAIHRRLAYVPGDVDLWPGLTGGQCIDLLGRFQGSQDKRLRAELIERLELDPTKRARTYSKGNRQKVALVAALSTRADLLVLDEPTSGLDPLMEHEFQKVIAEVATQGRTVLLSSHILDEVEALCDRVTIIRAGRAVSTGTLADLRHDTLTRVDAVLGGRDLPLTAPGLRDVRWSDHQHGHRLSFRVDADHLNPALEQVLAGAPTSITVSPPSLDELFLDQYRTTAEAPR